MKWLNTVPLRSTGQDLRESALSLKWGDIFLRGVEIDFQSLLVEWSHIIRGPVQPVGMSAFGDIYFLKPDGSIQFMDVLEGEIRVAAATQAEFTQHISSQEWLDANLMPEVVWQLRSRGLFCGPGQVYGFAPHPALVGKIEADTAMVFDSTVWNSICRQTVG